MPGSGINLIVNYSGTAKDFNIMRDFRLESKYNKESLRKKLEELADFSFTNYSSTS
jgi:hypothetical protein